MDTQNVIARLESLLTELLSFWDEATQTRDLTLVEQKLSLWQKRTARAISESVDANEGGRFGEIRNMVGYANPYKTLEREVDMLRTPLAALIADLRDHPEDYDRTPDIDSLAASNLSANGQPALGRAVFIVHGHDEVNAQLLSRLIRERWHLEPKILKAEPWVGRTLVEKFEEEAHDAGFAFVLMTPDDLVLTPQGEYTQARPNVIFELGWFYGRLGRSRTSILFKRGSSIHSDLNGVGRIEFIESVGEKVIEIESELNAAGLFGI